MRFAPANVLPLLALLVLTMAGLTACGGKAARERSQALLESQSGEKWFCQIAEDQRNWDCVQSNALAAAPVPERMPVPREELVALEVLEVEVDELNLDGTDAVETVVVETDVVETVVVETDVVETVVAETDAVELDIDEIDVVETETGELEIDETAVVETESSDPDAIATAANSAHWPRAELYAFPDDAYVVELVVMPSAETLDYLIKDQGLTDVIAVRVAADGVFHYVLLMGPYADEPSAQEIVALPPDRLQDFQLRVISVRSLKGAMHEAEELANEMDDPGYVAEVEVAETDGVEQDLAAAETNTIDLPSVELSILPDDAYVVQLVAMRSAQTLDSLINDRGLTDVFPARVAADGEIYHVLLIGPYADEPSAQEAAAVPPEQLQDFHPWVRSVRSLKAAMREADELSANGVDDQG